MICMSLQDFMNDTIPVLNFPVIWFLKMQLLQRQNGHQIWIEGEFF